MTRDELITVFMKYAMPLPRRCPPNASTSPKNKTGSDPQMNCSLRKMHISSLGSNSRNNTHENTRIRPPDSNPVDAMSQEVKKIKLNRNISTTPPTNGKRQNSDSEMAQIQVNLCFIGLFCFLNRNLG